MNKPQPIALVFVNGAEFDATIEVKHLPDIPCLHVETALGNFDLNIESAVQVARLIQKLVEEKVEEVLQKSKEEKGIKYINPK